MAIVSGSSWTGCVPNVSERKRLLLHCFFSVEIEIKKLRPVGWSRMDEARPANQGYMRISKPVPLLQLELEAEEYVQPIIQLRGYLSVSCGFDLLSPCGKRRCSAQMEMNAAKLEFWITLYN